MCLKSELGYAQPCQLGITYVPSGGVTDEEGCRSARSGPFGVLRARSQGFGLEKVHIGCG